MSTTTYKILLVDDDKFFLEEIFHPIVTILTNRLMDETCLTVTTLAYDGVEGWGIYQKMKPDIVYTDYHMPIMDGGQFAKKIAEYSYQPKAIFLVSNDPRSIEPNITRYINKKDVMDLFFQMKKKEMESKKQPGPPTF